MQEELFTSGRNIPHIDPSLEIWHWPISLYLFLGGLAAGLLFFAALFTLMGKDKEYPTAVKYASVIPPIALSVGLLATDTAGLSPAGLQPCRLLPEWR